VHSRLAARSPNASTTGSRSIRIFRRPSYATRERAAWTACPLLPYGMSGQQRYSRLERPGLSRPMERCCPAIGTPPTISRSSLDGFVPRRAKRRCVLGINQPARDHPSRSKKASSSRGFEEGWIRPETAPASHRKEGGRRRLRSSGIGVGSAALPSWPRRHCIREGLTVWWSPALRNTVQAGKENR